MFGLFSIQAWAWALAALGLGLRLRSLAGPVPRAAATAAMPFFVLHQPVILAIAFFVVETAFALPVKVVAVVLPSFLVAGTVAVLVARAEAVSALFGVKP